MAGSRKDARGILGSAHLLHKALQLCEHVLRLPGSRIIKGCLSLVDANSPRQNLQRGKPGNAEGFPERPMLVAVGLHHLDEICGHRIVLDHLRELCVLRGQALAVPAPRRVEFGNGYLHAVEDVFHVRWV